MGRTKALIGEHELALAISERESLSDWKLVHKLTGIIAYANHSARQVGEMLGTTTETVIRWASAFKHRGIDGLHDRAKGHRPRRLDAAAERLIREWVTTARDADGKKVHWTIKRLCIEAHQRLGVTIGHTAMGESLHRMGLALKRPRPSHYQADPARAAEFKKKPQPKPRRSGRSTRTG